MIYDGKLTEKWESVCIDMKNDYVLLSERKTVTKSFLEIKIVKQKSIKFVRPFLEL